MSKRLDILIFGATGYTGQYVIEEMARKANQFGFKWGIAGRTASRLKQVLQEASNVTGIENLTSNVDTIVANVTNSQSLIDMCAHTKVLINCVGPYRLYGEPVVEACIQSRTHYIDICGEPQFLETIQLRYDSQAQEREIAIVGSCGFDSLIADLGAETIRQQCEQNNLEIASIESYITLNFPKSTRGLMHYATWESAVYGISHANELKPLRRKLFQQKLPYPNYKIEKKSLRKTTIRGKSYWAVPFPGSDKSVVQRTQYFNYTKLNKKPIHFQPYFQMPSFMSAVKLVFFGCLFSLFTKFKLGIQCLLKFPRLFSAGLVTREGAARADCEQASFKMTFITHAENDQKLIHELTGPDPGYITTSILTIGCAIMLLKENDRLPFKGGVFTPAVAFGRTSLMNYLDKEGISLTQKIQTQQILRQYTIKKDFFGGFKAGEYSIYDQSGNILLFRFESRYGFTQTAQLYAYPGKQMVASIRNNWSPWLYDAEIQVFDTIFNQWIPGRITQAFPNYSFRYIIQYANRHLIMEHNIFSLTTEIRNEQPPNYILARMRLRLSSIILPNKYDLQVYTNELPDVIYFLALAAYDYNNGRRIRSGQNGK
ncbi:unnamed protein product [Rotaria sordida]|uniref:Saccharopine dehydrogenase NADP binding domain-containing protein n=1 Tax=Rotaria sordida TaxID=392033 RepID=A0A814M7G6_9BILA|nr:unnamed protein product [Rotaria sordida]CAF3737744.1 unnamed protein product [Rotaria sordida]